MRTLYPLDLLNLQSNSTITKLQRAFSKILNNFSDLICLLYSHPLASALSCGGRLVYAFQHKRLTRVTRL